MRSLPVALVLAACTGCHAETKAPAPPPPQSAVAPVESPQQAAAAAAPIAAPETEADRGIRHDLDLAIRRDAQLRDRQISFLVANGDISVTGVVKDERERRRINELALSITGVKSVANALRIEE